jgi:hypothetical protein
MMKSNTALALVGILALTGCKSGVYEDTDSPGDYWISALPPGGAVGGTAGLEASPDIQPAEAARLCPAGYTKISEKTIAHDGQIRWHIHCNNAPPAG